jgi:formylglycine-generating enzyme
LEFVRLKKLVAAFLVAATAAFIAVSALRGTPEGRASRTEPARKDSGSTKLETPPEGISAPAGMVWIAGREFRMGSDDPLSHPEEEPPHRTRVKSFWIDEHEVTNAEFRKFVQATEYVTTAERPVDWEELKKQVPPGTPKPPDEKLPPGSLVFTPPKHSVPLNDINGWWTWTTGANWQHPEGPSSNLDGRENHPVVQVSWDDAVMYARWAGKRLPTEAEWELAARGGLEAKPFCWGDEYFSDEKPQANIWQGDFPESNTLEDKFARTAPVKSFPPNGYGLYDMAGNVWEWCSDWYDVTYYARLDPTQIADNPRGPDRSFNPMNPYEPQRSQRGGSFLCSDSYCSRYRPGARHGCSPETGMSHCGFRCVVTPEMIIELGARQAEREKKEKTKETAGASSSGK